MLHMQTDTGGGMETLTADETLTTDWPEELPEVAYRRGYVDGYVAGWEVAIDADVRTMRRHLAALERWREGDCTTRVEPPEALG